MGFGRRSRHVIGGGSSDAHGGGLTITPLLDLFVAIISFLIIGAVITKINIVEVGLSKPVTKVSASSNPNSFDLLLKVSDRDVQIFLKNQIVKSVNRSGNIAWMEEVHSKLVEIKRQNPTEYRMKVEPIGQVNLETLMNVMDAGRKLKDTDVGIESKDEAGNKIKLQYLFPNVVLRGVYI